MRVFSQINKCQEKKKRKKKQNKRGAPLLGLGKSIYYLITAYTSLIAH